ncbi:hypothetical protein BP00DRAFT_429899 [Aspergillus indologenus CBS 114.80]|uniref:Uncharacterized protein n=1 Tax=Aspergillus indologenus CBS 114.80 TaxID=1450541 RepID=A0A2V5IED3_9EURO|nr:hypothetical protein BP00DRAFT_429899 [Aspergillus indologenus CBS 114.80]
MKWWMDFLSMVSLTGQRSGGRATTSEYGTTDHEVWVLDRTLSDRCVEAILEVPAVRKYRESGYLRDRPIYVVTGVRITRSSFPVVVRDDSRVSIRSSASASDPTGTVPITAGFEADVRSARTVLDEYNTAPDIVFAYRVHVLRDIGDGEVDQEMFAHRAAFMTGTASDSGLEYLEVNPQILEEDINRPLENVQVHPIGDDEAWISGGFCLADH